MTMTKYLAPVAFAATFALAAAPAYAQHRGGGGHGGGHAVSRGGGGGVSVARGGVYGSSVYRGGVRGGVAVVRGGVRVAPRIVGPRVFFGGPAYYYRPYYTFRPRLSLGFGLWAGYPVPYPYYDPYYYGYGYPYPADPYGYGYAAPSYGYPAQPYAGSSAPSYPSSGGYSDEGSAPNYPQQAPSVGVQQGTGDAGDQQAPGGVSFQITPDTAAVFVDGTYVGTAGTFGPKAQPLGLIPGRHHIEIRASGYHTMTFDADVTPGQVIPYQGTLQRN